MEKILYLGLDPSRFATTKLLVHCPLIQIVPKKILKPLSLPITSYTDFVFTSREAVMRWNTLMPPPWIQRTLAIGQATALLLPANTLVAPHATQEGMAQLLRSLHHAHHLTEHKMHCLWPRSQKARPVLTTLCRQWNISLHTLDLYDVQPQQPNPLPSLEDFTEIVFTSPSCVDAFLKIFGTFPRHIQLTAIGPMTQHKIQTTT